jgi:hypothetical protein
MLMGVPPAGRPVGLPRMGALPLPPSPLGPQVLLAFGDGVRWCMPLCVSR